MMIALIWAVLAANAVVSIFRPWMGIVLAYLVTLLTPQNIWWWAFGDLRPSFYIIVPALIGTLFAALRGQLHFSRLNTKTNWCVFILFLCLNIAYYFGPFVNVVNEYRFFEPDWMYSTVQKNP